MSICPYCEATLVSPLVCASCGALLDLESEVSPFAVFGLAPSWELDVKALKRELLRMSRQVHPDFYATAEAEVRQRAERASATLNEAFETLSDDFSRADWIVRDAKGPSESEERQMPQAFLMQVMEWNEILEEARDAAADSAEAQAARELSEQLTQERAARFEAIGSRLTPLPEPGSDELTEARRELNVVRYIDRTRGELEGLRLANSRGEHV